MHPPEPSALQQTRLLQHPNMLGYGGQRDAVGRSQFPHTGLPLGQPGEHAPAGGVGQGREYHVQAGSQIINHVVNYWPWKQCCQWDPGGNAT